jgi:hypothetical protein
VKRIRRLARPAAALTVLGLVSWLFFGAGTAGVALGAQAPAHETAWAGTSVVAERDTQALNQLTTGCNQITETGLPAGGKVADWITSHIQPATVVVAVWHYDNPSQSYKAAFFQNPAVPVDIPNFTGPVDAFFVCVSASATAP